MLLEEKVCGIRRDDGSLACFFGRYDRPFSMERGHSPGLFGAYRIPVEGRVVSVGRGEVGQTRVQYAFTDDGAVHQWDLNRAPRVVHRFPAPVASWSRVRRVDLARLTDGRVYARGIESASQMYEWGSGEHRDFLEIEALRGARIYSEGRRACAILPSGEVQCWGSCYDNTELGPGGCRSETEPHTVAAFRGASQIFLGSGITCARFDGMRLRCVGERLERRLPGRLRRGVLEVDLDRVVPTEPERRP